MDTGQIHRRRLLVVVLLALALGAVGAFGALGTGSSHPGRGSKSAAAYGATSTAIAPAQQPPAGAFPTVGIRSLRLYDRSRGRLLVTQLLYPAVARHPVNAEVGAPARAGPFPLIVFGHGFAVTPSPYRPLLARWVRAGYVVAAPLFPRGNEHAPGGPYEPDLPNQPQDMIFVIQTLRRLAAAGGQLAGLLSARVAVAGQSDGGDTALAAAFDPAYHSPRIDAAVILSGAEDPFAARVRPRPGTPLLATQGTADTVNLPSETFAYFDAAAPPKYLLLLEGAEHQAPYTQRGAELDAVARTTTAFLDRYLRGESGPLAKLIRVGGAGLASQLHSYP
ncbi:MAG: alpha/beta hydrolase family protein [Solirubrobacteraceae bacterium]